MNNGKEKEGKHDRRGERVEERRVKIMKRERNRIMKGKEKLKEKQKARN